MTSRVSSFTEYALLNRWALDCFAPSDFQKRRVASTGQSALKTLKDAKVNPYSSLKNSSYLYYANKFFITAPLKIAYVAAVTLTISRLGVVVNGLLTAYSYLRYKITSSGKDEAWEKTKGYAFACFADFSSATVGALATTVLINSTFNTLHFCSIGSWMGECKLPLSTRVEYIALFAFGIILGCAGLMVAQYPSVAPQFLARPQDRVGMYLSMVLRQGLGIVNEKGGLLPFSKEDQMEYREETRQDGKTYITFNGVNCNTVVQLVLEAEWELLETVRECNRYIKIKYRYPFDGETVAREIESQLKFTASPSSGTALMAASASSPLYPLIARLRSLGTKIAVLKEIYIRSRKLTVDDSIPVQLIKMASKTPFSIYKIDPITSFIHATDYRAYYNLGSEKPSREPPADKEVLNTIRWDTFTQSAIEPNTAQRPAGRIEAFRYDIGVCKWASANKQPLKPLRAFFGLGEDASFSDYKKKKREYSLLMHPDKNNSPDAKELFQCLNSICQELDAEYNKQ